MFTHRFPFALFIVGLLLSQSVYTTVFSAPTYDDIAAGKKDDPPRPKPKPGPREGGDE